MTNSAQPFTTLTCYACDAEARGVRDRRPEGGIVEAACSRHADPTIKAYAAGRLRAQRNPARRQGAEARPLRRMPMTLPSPSPSRSPPGSTRPH